MAQTILIVDDEEQVIDFLKPFLLQEGYQVLTAKTGKEGLQKALEAKPGLVLLDWMLPEMNGMDVCRELRQKAGAIGIIMLTARAGEADKVIGLEFGADDYITKPFSLREMLARARAVLRRIEGHERTDVVIECGALTISESQCRVWNKGEGVDLTPTEFRLLLTLAAKPGVVYSRLQLLQSLQEDDIWNDERTVDAHVSRLRRKLEEDPARPAYIQTVYGFGYRFGDQS